MKRQPGGGSVHEGLEFSVPRGVLAVLSGRAICIWFPLMPCVRPTGRPWSPSPSTSAHRRCPDHTGTALSDWAYDECPAGWHGQSLSPFAYSGEGSPVPSAIWSHTSVHRWQRPYRSSADEPPTYQGRLSPRQCEACRPPPLLWSFRRLCPQRLTSCYDHTDSRIPGTAPAVDDRHIGTDIKPHQQRAFSQSVWSLLSIRLKPPFYPFEGFLCFSRKQENHSLDFFYCFILWRTPQSNRS